MDQSMPAIVSINVIKEEQKDNKTIDKPGSGSGFIFQKDGYILTNEHVVHGAKKITVRLYDGSRHNAKLVGGDQNTDIAVVKIEREQKFPVLQIEDSNNVRVGQFAIAIGDPIGFRYTVTSGIVGGKDRCFHGKNKLFQYHQNYIQTDAWINPGSSGGPLLNIQGNVIGINSLNPGEGSTLAIDCGLAKKIGHQLIAHGRIIRGYIDAEMQSVSQGIKITQVKPNTQAYQCGLKRNDIIVEFEGKKVQNVTNFELLVMECQIGDQFPIKVKRKAQEISLNLTIDEMPLELVGRTVETKSVSWKTLGLAVRKLENDNFKRYAYLTDEDIGIIVEKVRKDSPGSEAKVPRGALITAINGQKIVDVKTLENYLKTEQDMPELILEIKGIHGTENVTIMLNNSQQAS